MPKRTLRVVSGTRAGTLVDIAGEVVIGREGVDLELADDEQASRRHTAVRPVDGGIEVEDLGSLNGTFVDGERLAGAVTVSTAAVLRVGETEMALEIEQPAPVHDATVLRDVPIQAAGDMTVERPVMNGPGPDVTRAREIPAPDVTRARPVPTSDVPTTPADVPATPDVTRARPIATPDVTRARPIATPDATRVRAIPGAQAPDTPAPATPDQPARSGPPLVLLGVGLAIIIAIVLVLLFVV